MSACGPKLPSAEGAATSAFRVGAAMVVTGADFGL